MRDKPSPFWSLLLAGAVFVISGAAVFAKAPMMVGGFAEQDASRREYQQVAGVAERLMNEKYPGRHFRLAKLKQVYTQVVAGLNYKLIGDYQDRDGSGVGEIVVFRDLSGKFSILREATAPNGNAPMKRLEYVTTFGGSIIVELLPADRISVSCGKTRHILPRAISASGARYSKDGLTFWMKGDDATWEDEKNNERVRCSLK